MSTPASTIRWPWFVTALLLALLFAGWHATHPQRVTPDSMEYTRMAVLMRGGTEQQALTEAALARCASLVADPVGAYTRAVPRYADEPGVAQRFPAVEQQRAGRYADVPDEWMNPCVAYVLDHPVTTDPRYSRIFDSRPLYPALTAPLLSVLTPDLALVVVSSALAALAGLAVFGIAIALHWAPWTGLVAQAMVYLLPIGAQGARPLTEGTTWALTCLLLLGSAVAARRRLPGVALAVGAALMLTFARYPTGLFIGLSAIGLTVLWSPWLGWRGIRSSWPVLAGPLVALAGAMVVPRLLGWAGTADSLQDVVANHFTEPDKSEPVELLLAEISQLAARLGQDSSFTLPALGVLALLAWALAVCRTLPATLALCTPLLIALGNVLAHPALGEARRLFSLSGMTVALSAAAVLHWLVSAVRARLAERRATDG